MSSNPLIGGGDHNPDWDCVYMYGYMVQSLCVGMGCGLAWMPAPVYDTELLYKWLVVVYKCFSSLTLPLRKQREPQIILWGHFFCPLVVLYSFYVPLYANCTAFKKFHSVLLFWSILPIIIMYS